MEGINARCLWWLAVIVIRVVVPNIISHPKRYCILNDQLGRGESLNIVSKIISWRQVAEAVSFSTRIHILEIYDICTFDLILARPLGLSNILEHLSVIDSSTKLGQTRSMRHQRSTHTGSILSETNSDPLLTPGSNLSNFSHCTAHFSLESRI